MNILVCGYGSIGRRHLKNAMALRAHSLAVCDVDKDVADKARDELMGTCRVFSRVHQAITEFEPDAIIIATPAFTHTRMMRTALDSGTPFLVEKPLCTYSTLHEARALVQECRQASLPCAVGYNLRYQKHAAALKAGVGYAEKLHLELMCDMATWPGSAADGDPIAECSHEIDLAMWLGARPALNVEFLNSDTAVRIMFHNGVVRLNWAWRVGYHRRWEVANETFSGKAAFNDPKQLGDEMYADELSDFLLGVKTWDGPASGCSLEEGVRVMDVCADAVNRLKHQAQESGL